MLRCLVQFHTWKHQQPGLIWQDVCVFRAQNPFQVHFCSITHKVFLFEVAVPRGRKPLLPFFTQWSAVADAFEWQIGWRIFIKVWHLCCLLLHRAGNGGISATRWQWWWWWSDDIHHGKSSKFQRTGTISNLQSDHTTNEWKASAGFSLQCPHWL